MGYLIDRRGALSDHRFHLQYSLFLSFSLDVAHHIGSLNREKRRSDDVPLSKVEFNTIHEYEYITNFKVLQNAFAAHGIDKVVPVERLTKMKFQDNLEFMQWMKKYWDAHYPAATTTQRADGRAPSA